VAKPSAVAGGLWLPELSVTYPFNGATAGSGVFHGRQRDVALNSSENLVAGRSYQAHPIHAGTDFVCVREAIPASPNCRFSGTVSGVA